MGLSVRINRVKRPNKTYEYVQLVKAYRRKRDGKAAVRVIANLGRADQVDADNIRRALEASRKGLRVVVETALPQVEPAQPVANLQYLDVAVLLEIWRAWGLPELLSDLMPAGAADVRPADVVAALAIHRCAGPRRSLGQGSKVSAASWFDETALPELLQVAPPSFNNSRLHRVLQQLERVTPALMRALPQMYLDQEPAFTALFADITDAVFVGQGPELAVKGRTKSGVIQRKIGIAALCNRLGYPLRWEVVAGNTAEQPVLAKLYQAVAGESWAYHVPIICDRAMGASSNIGELLQTGLYFLTAVRKPEFPTYAREFPAEALEALVEQDENAPVQAIAQTAEEAGLTRVDDTLFVVDLGVLEAAQALPEAPTESEDRCRTALQLALAVERAVETGEANSYNAAARQIGLTIGMSKGYRRLLDLCEEVQAEVLSGRAQNLSLSSLYSLRSLDPGAQKKRFDELCSAPGKGPGSRGQRPSLPETPRVRVVAYFNPEQFVGQRAKTAECRNAIDDWQAELNERLQSPRSKMTRDKIVAAVDRRLRKEQLLDAYEVHIDRDPTDTHFQVELDPLEDEFRRRSRYAGFSLLVGHPDIPHSAEELARLYRAKDGAIEKSFRTIKSVITLEPVRHQTDPKVKAHVTLCMLALLLERTLRTKLEGKQSAPNALATLRSCRLNQYKPPAAEIPPTYRITYPTTAQKRLLQTLQLESLIDEDEVACRTFPR